MQAGAGSIQGECKNPKGREPSRSLVWRAAQSGELDINSVGADTAAALFVSLLRGESQMECLTHPDAQPSAAQRDHWVGIAVVTFLKAFGRAQQSNIDEIPKRQ